MPPCPSLVYKIPAPPLPGGKRWSWVALHARHHAWHCSFWRTQQNWRWPPTLLHILCLLYSGHPTWFFLVSLKASCPQRACLDPQNMYILKAVMYFTRLSSRSESRSVVSDSLQTHGPYSPWNSPGQNTGVGSLFLLQGIFPTQGLNPGFPCFRQILYQLSHKGSPCRLRRNM